MRPQCTLTAIVTMSIIIMVQLEGRGAVLCLGMKPLTQGPGIVRADTQQSKKSQGFGGDWLGSRPSSTISELCDLE